MRCSHCGRWLTFHRGEEHPPIVVLRGEKPDAYEELEYCGACFDLERHEHQPGDVYLIGLGDDPASQHWEPLYLSVAA